MACSSWQGVDRREIGVRAFRHIFLPALLIALSFFTICGAD